MGPSPYLPERERLDALFAGALAPASAPARPATPATPRLRFPIAAEGAIEPATGLSSAPPRPASIAPGGMPLAEIDDEHDALGPVPEDATLEQRLDQLLLWLVGSTGAFAAFVADGEGLALANRHAPESYLVATAALGIAERAMSEYVPRPQEGSTVIDLDGTNVLHIIWASTSAGRLAVGLVLAAPLDRALAAKARRILRKAVERKGMPR